MPLKVIVNEAIVLGGCDSLKYVVVYQRTRGKIAWEQSRDRWLHELTCDLETTCEPVRVNAEHPPSALIICAK